MKGTVLPSSSSCDDALDLDAADLEVLRDPAQVDLNRGFHGAIQRCEEAGTAMMARGGPGHTVRPQRLRRTEQTAGERNAQSSNLIGPMSSDLKPSWKRPLDRGRSGARLHEFEGAEAQSIRRDDRGLSHIMRPTIRHARIPRTSPRNLGAHATPLPLRGL